MQFMISLTGCKRLFAFACYTIGLTFALDNTMCNPNFPKGMSTLRYCWNCVASDDESIATKRDGIYEMVATTELKTTEKKPRMWPDVCHVDKRWG